MHPDRMLFRLLEVYRNPVSRLNVSVCAFQYKQCRVVNSNEDTSFKPEKDMFWAMSLGGSQDHNTQWPTSSTSWAEHIWMEVEDRIKDTGDSRSVQQDISWTPPTQFPAKSIKIPYQWVLKIAEVVGLVECRVCRVRGVRREEEWINIPGTWCSKPVIQHEL